jgi:hypothetical protein
VASAVSLEEPPQKLLNSKQLLCCRLLATSKPIRHRLLAGLGDLGYLRLAAALLVAPGFQLVEELFSSSAHLEKYSCTKLSLGNGTDKLYCLFRVNYHRNQPIQKTGLMKFMKILKLSPTREKLLRELVVGDLNSLLELPASEKLGRYFQKEYAELYALAKDLGAKLGKFPKQLRATAEDLENEKKPTDPAVVKRHREFLFRQAQEVIRRLSKFDIDGAL